MAFSIGFIVGPLAGAWFAISNATSPNLWGETPALYALLLSLINIAVVLLFVPETLPKVCILILLYFYTLYCIRDRKGVVCN